MAEDKQCSDQDVLRDRITDYLQACLMFLLFFKTLFSKFLASFLEIDISKHRHAQKEVNNSYKRIGRGPVMLPRLHQRRELGPDVNEVCLVTRI